MRATATRRRSIVRFHNVPKVVVFDDEQSTVRRMPALGGIVWIRSEPTRSARITLKSYSRKQFGPHNIYSTCGKGVKPAAIAV
jgi:hypothetical protein